MNFPIRFRSVVIVSLLVVLVGCGENRGLVKIAGTVTCDGKAPPAAGSMVFLPEPGQTDVQEGTATFDKDGKFTASTWQKGDGLRPGRYKIRIECWEAKPSFSSSKGVSLIDRKYADWGNDSAMPRLEVFSGKSKTDVIFDVNAAADATIQEERTTHQKVEANAPKTMQ